MYREAIFNLAVLKHCLKIKGKEEGLVLKNALNKELELYNYDMIEDIVPQLDYLVKLGWLELTDDKGYVNITEQGIKKLQSGELQNEIASLNIGIQNIYLQRFVLAVGFISILIQVLGLLFYK
jgi:hypothetical protein